MVYENRSRFVNKVRVRKDRHSHNAHPRTAPINLVWSYRDLITNGFNLILKNNIPNTFEIFKKIVSRFPRNATASAMGSVIDV